jgi:hypothetical protein
MKLFLKIGKLLALVIITLSVILLSGSYLLKDKVGFIILKSLNKNLSTRLDVESYHLSFLRKFPKASLELKNVLVHSSAGLNTAGFSGINTDTLLAAHSVLIEFRMTDILKGIYTIEKISAREGKANFFIDNSGGVNYNVSLKSNTPDGKETIIDLKRINLTNIYTYYNDLGTQLIIAGKVKNGKLKSRISGDKIDFNAGTDMQITRFQLYNFNLSKPIPANLDVNLLSSGAGVTFRKSTVRIDNYDFGIEGTVSSDDFLDLNITGRNLDLSVIRRYLPEKYLSYISDYDPSGNLIIRSKIKGLLNKTSNPHIEIDWQLRNGKVSYKKSDLIIKDISFEGKFSNGIDNQTETSSISIKGFNAKLGSSECTGSASLKKLKNPLLDLSLKGRIFPGELKEFFGIKYISAAEGSVDFNLNVIGAALTGKSLTPDGIIDLKPVADLTFNSLTLGLRDNKLLLNNVSGVMKIQNSIEAKNILLNYKGQNIKIGGKFNNLPEWLAGRPVTFSAEADVVFDKFFPEEFMGKPDTSGRSQNLRKGFNLPDDIILDIKFRADSLSYKTFLAAGVEGILNYHPKLLNIMSLKMYSLKGLISGNGFIAQNSNKSLMTKGIFNVSNIDINKAFTTFHDFGQTFLKAENIKGSLSGSLSLLFPMDSMLTFHINTLTAEGKYHLVNGALINFDPVKQLSSFIELSELKNINFEQLDNDFFIRNNFLFIPQMEVKSSAADLSVNGKHSFDNDYEYHVKILLSEILSRKREKNKSNVTEFGVVEDDGLGRTSLLLKITGNGDNARIAYDIKAAGAEVKTAIKKERQTLKTILNQEYGWYKSDSTLNQKPAEKKPKFRIQWDDGDSVKGTQDPASVKKENNSKTITRKK